jgi:hypothetical protein
MAAITFPSSPTIGQQYTAQNATVPSGTPRGKDIVSFVFVRTSSAWTVLGCLSGYNNT